MSAKSITAVGELVGLSRKQSAPLPMSTNEPFVNVVTPVYNTADFLREAIESVLAQSYGNFEYIIVNNCSTDGSREIAQEYAHRDNRLKVVDNVDFLSQGANYNHALRQISPAARYCKMVQADDWIFPNCLSEMVRVAELDSQIATVGAYQLAGDVVKCQGLACRRADELYSIVTGREACRMYLLRNRYLFGTPTSVMYRADLVRSRNQFFREDSIHEDSEVCFELLGDYKFGFVHRVLTYTRVDNESISSAIEDLQPDARHAYLILRKYGRLHLTEAEYAYHLERTRKEHHRWLAYNVGRRRDKKFWDFQEEGFRLAGDRLNWRTLLLLQVPRVARWFGNPLSTLQTAAQLVTSRLRRRDATPIE